ncbi:MAG: hypothetical protein CME33_25625 [Gimesia sp.]|uniref:DUF4419 domain-containing protein n=1 Tax=Gimesia sp. TaxID=2024833 RepID=UPI000C3D1305|nr:DUF4419 domain-containing protein [Gimesia sp.]MAX39938.1 hypothetical protein [Gimesia sp.]|tara:strand:+ start:19315 stop:20454 length:1140 start_codon:yes stop_codon:yes gene_type:complete
MTYTTFPVSPDVTPKTPPEKVDYIGKLRVALRRPIEATWLPREPLVACDDDHALITAMKLSFYDHFPLRLSPDSIWITLARGFALHVNENAEALRHRFVSHSGKQDLKVCRMDFMPGEDNPWPEVFEEFSDQIAEQTGGMSELVQADFSTTGPVERAVSNLMAMETFKSYFEYILYAGCGTPSITLTGTIEDWEKLRQRVQRFADYGLNDWINALDPVLEEFVDAKKGQVNTDFWKSMFRYNSGSGPAVMTGWANVLFPYFKNSESEKLYPNPFLNDWRERLTIDDQQDWQERGGNPQGVGLAAIPSCFTSVPLTVFWGKEEAKMRLVGGLLGVSQNSDSLEVEPECGWVVVYEEPIDTLSAEYHFLEEQQRYRESRGN